MRIVIATSIAFLSLLTSIHAEELGDDRRTAQFVNKLMTATMMCEPAIGDAHYQAARTMGAAKLSKYLGRIEAVKAVKGIETRLKNDPQMAEFQRKAEAKGCFKEINDLYFEYSDLP